MKWSILALVLSAFAVRALADDEAPDKSAYTLFNPTPDDDLRSFNTDRPPKANSPYTVDAGHFQYETNIAVFGYGNAGLNFLALLCVGPIVEHMMLWH